MKKQNLAMLAVLGISVGLMGGCQQKSTNGTKANGSNGKAMNGTKPNGSNGKAMNGAKSNGSNGKAMNGKSNGAPATLKFQDDAFKKSLSPAALQKYDQLDAENKMKAMEMAEQSCNGKNACAGMGGCKSATNSECAGHNSCKGQGGAPIKDPNKAVEIQYQNQMEASY